ncbi:unnamed protein product [Penicillium roqueforti FM164]|uniref:Uncharacterized protein n=1 Tax=Penicillium roqueforti (strain FM164) TaxID=1365484 RepID=W6QKF4_PENRF|nr:unnamed protein product [Penicillium roqueforti FM164]
MHVKPSNMSLQIVAANSTRGSQQASIKKCVLQRLLSSWWLTETEKPTNTSSIPGNLLYDYSPVYIVDQQIRQCLSMDIRPYASARATASCGLFILVLTIRTYSHFHAKGHPIIDGKIYCASGLFRQIEDKTKVAADERASSRLPPSSHHLHTAMESLDLWHRDTFIHHGSAMFIASGFVTRVYCLNKLSCAPQRGFFEASADYDELEYDVAWLVTALQKVVIVRFVYMIQLLNSDQPIPLPESYLWLSMQPFKYLQVA